MQKTLETNSVGSDLPENGQAGFSVVELLLSLVIFLIVTGAVYGVMQIARVGRGVTNQQAQLTKSARIGLNLLGRETYNAGFGYPLKNTVVMPDNRITNLLGLPNDADTSRDVVPPVIAGNNITLNNLNAVPNTRTDQVTFLSKDPTFNLVGPVGEQVSESLNINAASTTSGIDEIVPITGSNSSCRTNDIYLVTGNTGSTLGLATALSGANKVQFANGDVLGFNQTGTSGPLRGITTPASLQRVKMITFFVTSDGILTRREYANVPPAVPAVGFVDEPLVYGVENFQIEFIMDDGTVSQSPANLEAVRQIRYNLDVRTVEVDSQGQPRRVSMSSTFSTRNLGYDAS